MRILVVEDDRKLADALQRGLAEDGHEVEAAARGDDALRMVQPGAFDLVLLDLMLPGLDGFEVLRAVRDRGVRVPILVLTARDAVSDRVTGLDAGADDYLVKPFAFAELLARVRALMRRGQPDRPGPLSLADLLLDPATRTAVRRGQPLVLTPREFALLEFFLRHKDRVVTRDMIARQVWQQPSRGTPLDNVIDVHVMRLRRKVDREGLPPLIHTIRGVGFVLKEDAA